MSTTGTNIKTKSVFPIDKSYLHFNFKCMTLLGMWNPYETGIKYRLYQLYTMYIIGVVLIMRTMNTFTRSLTAKSAIVFIQESSLLAAEVADIIKCIAFVCHRVHILELSNLFNWERQMLSGEGIKNHRDEVLRDSMNASKTFTIVIILCAIQYFIFYFYAAFVNSDYQVELLPIGSIPMKYMVISTKFWPIFIVDYFSYTLLGVVALCQDAFLMGAMINIAAQLKILNYRLEKCHMTHLSSDNYDKNNENLIIHFECVERIHSKSMTVDANEELINCIKFHQQIVKMLNIFKSIYNNVLLPQVFIFLSMTVLQLQIILFIILMENLHLKGTQQNRADSLLACLFLVALVMELLAFCWGANFILVESEETADSLYASHWYNEDRIFQNNVKIFLGAVRNPLAVTAGGFVDLTAETFKNILSKGYSLAAVLTNVNN